MPHATPVSKVNKGTAKGVGGEWWERVKRVKDSRRADDSQLATKVAQTDTNGVLGGGGVEEWAGCHAQLWRSLLHGTQFIGKCQK